MHNWQCGRDGSSSLDLHLLDSEGIALLLQEIDVLPEAKCVHAHIVGKGVCIDTYIGSLLLGMYRNCGALENARAVFDRMNERNVVTWNAMIAAYSKHGSSKMALQIFQQMKREGIRPNQVTFVSVLGACTEPEDLSEGTAIHKGITDSGFEADVVVANALISMYGKCGSLKQALAVFYNMHEHDVISWNAMIAACAKNGNCDKALELLEQMQQEGVKPTKFTFTIALSACAALAILAEGKVIHACIVDSGLESDVAIGNALILMYSKCGTLEELRSVFDKMYTQTVTSWTSMIVAYVQHGYCLEALELFQQMQLHGVRPNEYTFASILGACAFPAALAEGKSIHKCIFDVGLDFDVVVGNALVSMYSRCGTLNDARMVFDNMQQYNVASWTTMIDAFSQHGHSNEALNLFQQMQQAGMVPDQITFVSILGACANPDGLADGREIHACIVNHGFSSSLIENALVSMYGECRALEGARAVFDKMHKRDVVSWTAMITAYSRHLSLKEALQLLEEMQNQGVKPNEVTFIGVLGACASPAALEEGKAIHACIVDNGSLPDLIVGSALINMYGKCGAMQDAQLVFKRMHRHNLFSWNAMMSTYSQYGHGKDVVQLFQQMQLHAVEPNEVTYACLLSACSHAGLVEEGQGFFASMVDKHAITPTLEHYNCMIDLYGRAGLIDKAENIIHKMPLQPDAQVWITLLGACRVHQDVKQAENAAKHLSDLDPENTTVNVLLSNVYAAEGRWHDARGVRKAMGERGVKK